MKKRMFMLMFMAVIVVFAAACGKDETGNSQISSSKEDTTADTENDVQTEVEADTSVDNTVQEENTEEESTSNEELKAKIDNYLTSIKEQADAIKISLEEESLTQAEMNEKAGELYELWDDALNYIWGELKTVLAAEEFEKLLGEQRTWIAEKEDAAKEAGKEVEGGSMYSLVVNSEAAKITEERVYELLDLLK